MKKSILYSGTIYNYTVSAEYLDRGYGFPVIKLAFWTATHPTPICVEIMPKRDIKYVQDLDLELSEFFEDLRISEYFENVKKDNTMSNYPLPELSDQVQTAYYTVRSNSSYDRSICEYYPDRATMFRRITRRIFESPRDSKPYDIIVCENRICYPRINRYGTSIRYVDFITGDTIYTGHRHYTRSDEYLCYKDGSK